MTLQQVTDWLERLELGQYAEAFRDNHIDGATLRGLDDAECTRARYLTLQAAIFASRKYCARGN